MPLNESDTRAKLIDPAIHARGWTEDLICREETAGAVEIINGQPRRRAKGRVDYTLRVKVNTESQPVALALIEAKAENLPPTHGLEQGKLYAASKRLNVRFVFSTNGHLFVEYDRFAGLTSTPRPLTEFPTPTVLRDRYEQRMGFRLDEPAAAPMLARYPHGEGTRRYYQDAAIRAVLEKLAQEEKAHQPGRALLSLATGSGKTFIAVNLLRRIADAGRLKRALFVCDRDELRRQALGHLQNIFGADAAEVYEDREGRNHAKNARIHVATYQTLDVADEESTVNFLSRHYPENYFSHIVIDECHRSAWGKWSEVLTRNPNAVHVGLTATPRHLKMTERTKETEADAALTADNLRHFGEPVYEYDMAQGIEDGYLAACEIDKFDLFHDNKVVNERLSGVGQTDLAGKLLVDANTGEEVSLGEARAHYSAETIEDRLIMPDRVKAMTEHFFEQLLQTGGPEQKTIIFCARDRHADDVAAALDNLYAEWCLKNGKPRADFFAFKCTASVGGSDYIADLRGGSRHHFIATTVDLLTTGVDVPVVRNIVFFKYVRSPIAFYQMVGRGTRIEPPSGKLMFRVYDYTDATRLFGEEFISEATRPREKKEGAEPPRPPERAILAEGFEVRVSDAGTYILTSIDGKATPVTLEDYKERLAAKLVEEAPTLEEFRSRWIEPRDRRELMGHLPDAGRSPYLVRQLEDMTDYDLYDVLGELGYGLSPRTCAERADAFGYKHAEWLRTLPAATSETLQKLAGQFAQGGTDALENPHVFEMSEVKSAGGLPALKVIGNPAEVLHETKERIFAL